MNNLFNIKYKKKFPFIEIPLNDFSYILCVCLVTGFLGFFMETFFCYIVCDELLDRGFLCGPFIPVYAFVIFFLLLLGRIPKLNIKNYFLSAIVIGVIVTIIEFLVGEGLEALFGLELWDYRPWVPLSLHYISLPVSIAWGFGGAFYLMIFIPFVRFVASKINPKVRWFIIFVSLLAIFTDFLITLALIAENGKYVELYWRLICQKLPNLFYL